MDQLLANLKHLLLHFSTILYSIPFKCGVLHICDVYSNIYLYIKFLYVDFFLHFTLYFYFFLLLDYTIHVLPADLFKKKKNYTFIWI